MAGRGLGPRVDRLAARLARSAPAGAPARAEEERERAAFLALVPADLRAAVAAALADPVRAERLGGWPHWPVAPGAARPAGLPRAVVRAMLDDLAARALHECGACGLRVPIRPGLTHPPRPTVILFPTCPGCGGRTGYLAYPRPSGGADGTA